MPGPLPLTGLAVLFVEDQVIQIHAQILPRVHFISPLPHHLYRQIIPAAKKCADFLDSQEKIE